MELASMSCWSFVTALGDTAVLLPVFAITAAWLVARHQARLVLSWAMLLVVVAGLVIASKLAFMAWNLGITRLDFTGISGHTALSMAVWPPLCMLLVRRGDHRRMVAGSAGLVLVLLIAWSRVELHAHSVAEVVSAVLIGLAGTVIFLRAQWPHWSMSGGRMLPMVALLATLSVTYGHRFPSDEILRFAATQLNPKHMTFRRDALR
jgi:membrane-associated phospholipid phosphatase